MTTEDLYALLERMKKLDDRWEPPTEREVLACLMALVAGLIRERSALVCDSCGCPLNEPNPRCGGHG